MATNSSSREQLTTAKCPLCSLGHNPMGSLVETTRQPATGGRRESRERTNRYMTICWRISLAVLVCTMALALIWTVCLSIEYYSCTPEQRYLKLRKDFVAREQRRRLGGRLKLTDLEEITNRLLLDIKQQDEERHPMWSEYQLRPRFLARHSLNESHLYTVLRSMPKGALLHVHDVGMVKTDQLLELTKAPDLWTCIGSDGAFEDFRFSRQQPPNARARHFSCSWMQMSNLQLQDDHTKRKLRESLSLSTAGFTNATQLAQHLKRAHRLIHGLIMYRHLWPAILFGMLDDLYADGINYVEVRSSLPVMYDLDGTNYTIWDTAYTMLATTNLFCTAHNDFIGLRLIYAPVRDEKDKNLDNYLATALELKSRFPSLFVGLDLMNFGNECELPPLRSAVHLLQQSKDIDFYFHVGESRCSNERPDENVIDALLLGSRRLGNPIGLPLHPEVLNAMRYLKIAAEVCPLSNHYLQYMSDFGQHPVAQLIATDVPLVVGSDYPCFWNAAPLTDDFYAMFAGVGSHQANLRLLKQLALNSLIYSGLSEDEKRLAILHWHRNWNQWIEFFVNLS